MNIISISLLATLLLILANGGAQAAANKNKTAAPSVQKKALTPSVQKKTSAPQNEFSLLQKSAAQGVAEAQYKLGWMYSKGDGVP
ncbi:MAG: sel1 repeat family protein [Nitrosomonadales bacterium]|nr:sel1 repeat family protein [Nitrosomonadales bacterium]